MYLQGVDSVYDLVWTKGPAGTWRYRDIYFENEVEMSQYNFEHADVKALFRHFDDCERECLRLCEAGPDERGLPIPAYDKVLQASHAFNLLDARYAISISERQRYLLRVRTLARAVAECYYRHRESLGFPLSRNAGATGNG